MSVSAAITRSLLHRREEAFDPFEGLNPNDCTIDTCDLEFSYYGYQPSLKANAVLLAVFGFSCLAYIGQGILSRRFIGFTIAMVLGTLGETIGYVGRVMMHSNPWADVRSIVSKNTR